MSPTTHVLLSTTSPMSLTLLRMTQSISSFKVSFFFLYCICKHNYCLLTVPANVTAVTSSPAVGIEGQSVTLQFIITEADPPVKVENIRWQFSFLGNDVDITESESRHYRLSEDRRTLSINQLTTAEGGVYTLFATNEAGVRFDRIRVVIESKLVICLTRA